MAILAGLIALGSRFAGKILTTALGWASTLLFGRVPANRQLPLLMITFGSVIWIVLLAGVLFPDVATFLLVLVPKQELVPETVIRLVMLAAAIILPAVIGLLTVVITSKETRDARSLAAGVARGYPLTILLAGLLVFLSLLAIWRKTGSLARRRTDAHVPLIVEPGAYDQVAADLDRAVSDAGLDVEPMPAPAVMSRPARLLAMVGGPQAAALVPDRMIQLRGPELDILIYPMDLLISGKPVAVARARAAMASRLTTSAAHLTVSAEAQGIEDRLAALARGGDGVDGARIAGQPNDAGADQAGGPSGRAADSDRPRFDDRAQRAFESIDQDLATLEIPYEEWEVLYRQRLQVERDLRAGAMVGEAVVGAKPVDRATPPSRLTLRQVIRTLARAGAALVLLVADAGETGKRVERVEPEDGKTARAAMDVASAAAEATMEATNDLATEPVTRAGSGPSGDRR